MSEEETKAKQADRVFETVCTVLDEKGLAYSRDDEKRVAVFSGRGEDMKMQFNIRVDEVSQLVIISSDLPFNVPAENQINVMVAISATNSILKIGAFRFNLAAEAVDFSMASCFLNSIISKDAIKYMLDVAIMGVEDFNDKLYLVGIGRMDLKEYMEFVKSL